MSIYRLRDVGKRYFKVKIRKELILKTICICLIVLPAYYLNNLAFRIVALFATVLYAFDINKGTINVIKDMILKKIKK